MAVGTHWEWRAFGLPPLAVLLATMEKLSKVFGPDDEGETRTDEYFWAPGCDANVKLRDERLKFKRVLKRTDDGCELWAEEANENFPFPLADEAFEFLATHMNVKLPDSVSEGRESPAALEKMFSACVPPIRTVPVKKHRIQYEMKLGTMDFVIELAEIMAPQCAWSIALESENLPRLDSGDVDPRAVETGLELIRRLRDQLKLPQAMEVMGYLERLEGWV